MGPSLSTVRLGDRISTATSWVRNHCPPPQAPPQSPGGWESSLLQSQGASLPGDTALSLASSGNKVAEPCASPGTSDHMEYSRTPAAGPLRRSPTHSPWSPGSPRASFLEVTTVAPPLGQRCPLQTEPRRMAAPRATGLSPGAHAAAGAPCVLLRSACLCGAHVAQRTKLEGGPLGRRACTC